MNAYYTITQNLYSLFLEDQEVNTVDKGPFYEIDYNKKNVFPLVHLNVYGAGMSLGSGSIEFDVNVAVMNLRDERPQQETDKFIGNDNEDDNLNAMLMVIWRAFKKLEKEINDDGMYLVSFERPEPFRETEVNVVDGWMWRFVVGIKVDEVTPC